MHHDARATRRDKENILLVSEDTRSHQRDMYLRDVDRDRAEVCEIAVRGQSVEDSPERAERAEEVAVVGCDQR